ncbi:MAG: hypothetical protein KDD66_13635 [Bdellovibrionales bacterium]|nr:hypothetical protein [Bdellovibrionales bacterium]
MNNQLRKVLRAEDAAVAILIALLAVFTLCLEVRAEEPLEPVELELASAERLLHTNRPADVEFSCDYQFNFYRYPSAEVPAGYVGNFSVSPLTSSAHDCRSGFFPRYLGELLVRRLYDKADDGSLEVGAAFSVNSGRTSIDALVVELTSRIVLQITHLQTRAD